MATTTAAMRVDAASTAMTHLQRPLMRPETRSRATVLRNLGAPHAQRAASGSY